MFTFLPWSALVNWQPVIYARYPARGALTASSHHRGEIVKSVCYCALKRSERQKHQKETEENRKQRGTARDEKKEEGEMINPIKPLSVSSIGIVLRWLPLSSSCCGLWLG